MLTGKYYIWKTLHIWMFSKFAQGNLSLCKIYYYFFNLWKFKDFFLYSQTVVNNLIFWIWIINSFRPWPEKLERNRGSGIFLRTDEFINPLEWIKCKISLFVLLIWVWFPLLQDLLDSITFGYGNYLYWIGNWVDLREPCRGYTKEEAQVSTLSAFNTCYKLPVHFSCSFKQAWPDLCLEVILTDTHFLGSYYELRAVQRLYLHRNSQMRWELLPPF